MDCKIYSLRVNDQTRRVGKLIEELYQLPNCGTGAYCHIVTDDYNIEDEYINACIKIAKNFEIEWLNEYENKEAISQACIEILEQLLPLSLDERWSAINYKQKNFKPFFDLPGNI